MIGPVFALEWLRTGRRRRAHVLRWIFGAVLIVQLFSAYSAYALHAATPGAMADMASEFLRWTLLEQFLFVAVVTPALVAGTITDEKTRGTLETLLTSQLDAPAIVAGKLLARLADVSVLTLVALPLVAVASSLTGIGPAFVFGQAVVTILTAIGLSSVSILASVWSRHTRSAVLAVYLLIVAAVTLYVGHWWTLPAWVRWLDPIFVLRPAYEGGSAWEFLRRLGQSFAVWSCLSAVCVALASWRLRPAYLKQLAVRRRWHSVAHWLPRPAPSWNPLTWKESYCGRRIPRWLGLPAVSVATFVVCLQGMMTPAGAGAPPPAPAEVIMNLGWFAIAFLALLVAVHASGAITTERERQTWDGLMCSPMNHRDILAGKIRGIVAGAWPYVPAFALACALAANLVLHDWNAAVYTCGAGSLTTAALLAIYLPAFAKALWSALAVLWSLAAGSTVFAAVTVSLAIAWLSMTFVAAVGIWSSVRCRSSWRSLTLTSFVTLGGGTVLTCASAPVAGVTTLLGMLTVGLLESLVSAVADSSFSDRLQNDVVLALVPLFIAVGVALVFWLVARSLLLAAEVHLARTERIPSGRIRQLVIEQSRRERTEAQALQSA